MMGRPCAETGHAQAVEQQPREETTQALHLQDASRRGFDRVVGEYGARPGYPPEVFDVLQDRCGLGPGSEVLEVGPGTGQVTVPLAERGMEITAVELGAAMGERLRDLTAGWPVRVVVQAFEETDVADSSFDAVVSGTAFHWVEPVVGYTKAARALRNGGWIALWWTLFDQPDRPDGFFGELESLLGRVAPDVLALLGGPAGYCRDVEARQREFSAVGEFGPVEVIAFAWDYSHTPIQLRRLFATYSPVMALPDERRDRLLDQIEALAENGGRAAITRNYTTTMYLAQRQSRHRR